MPPSAVNRWRDAEASGEVGLELPPLLETRCQGLLVGVAAGEAIEELPVAALRGAQIGEEVDDLGVFDDLQKPGEPLAAPRLDHCAEQ